jgi:hypothetical protein
MYDPNSSILDFYPQEFELDLNGKKQDWEAVVKIPFIDERRLLAAMGGTYYYFTLDISLMVNQLANIDSRRASATGMHLERATRFASIPASPLFIPPRYPVSSRRFIVAHAPWSPLTCQR